MFFFKLLESRKILSKTLKKNPSEMIHQEFPRFFQIFPKTSSKIMLKKQQKVYVLPKNMVSVFTFP